MVRDNVTYIPQVSALNQWAIKGNVQGRELFTYGYEFDFKYVSITK